MLVTFVLLNRKYLFSKIFFYILFWNRSFSTVPSQCCKSIFRSSTSTDTVKYLHYGRHNHDQLLNNASWMRSAQKLHVYQLRHMFGCRAALMHLKFWNFESLITNEALHLNWKVVEAASGISKTTIYDNHLRLPCTITPGLRKQMCMTFKQ